MLNRVSPIFAIPACNALCVLPPLAVAPPQVVTAPAATLPPLARPVLPIADTQQNPSPSLPPEAVPALPLVEAQPFVAGAQDDLTSLRSLDCLTAAVYYEARSEPEAGQRAVAQVVLNRVRHPGFPSSVCGVVYQGAERSTGCQFTFACDGSMLAPREPGAWARSRVIAQQALAGSVDPDVGLATSYHAESVLPWWSRSLNKVATVGSQIFYSLRGALGKALSFNQSYSGVEPEPNPIAVAERPVTLAPPSRYTFADGSSVAVHRGGDAAAAAMPEASFGVRVHSGSRDAAARREDVAVATVKVHRGGDSDEKDPS